jgi:hypothetical protein
MPRFKHGALLQHSTFGKLRAPRSNSIRGGEGSNSSKRGEATGPRAHKHHLHPLDVWVAGLSDTGVEPFSVPKRRYVLAA